MKKIVVFGATGNIGIYLVDYLINNLNSEKYEVIAVGRKITKIFEKMNVKYFNIDITNKNDFLKLPNDNIYAVINLAGILPAYFKDFNPYKYIDVNIIGALNILEYSRKNNVNRILYSQSWADLAGYWGKEDVLKPYMPIKLKYSGDHAFYSITKSMIVDTLKFYKEEYGIKYFVFRLPNIYLYNPEKYYYVDGVKKVISYRYLIDLAKKGEPIELWGNPNSFKDIIYVKDLCQMMFLAINANCDGGIYNAGTGIKTTFEEQIKGIIEVFSTKNKSEIIYRPEKNNFDSFVMDISNAKLDLGYEPKYNYIDYLKDYKKEEELKRFDSLWIKEK